MICTYRHERKVIYPSIIELSVLAGVLHLSLMKKKAVVVYRKNIK
jgi:hypothetical protein